MDLDPGKDRIEGCGVTVGKARRRRAEKHDPPLYPAPRHISGKEVRGGKGVECPALAPVPDEEIPPGVEGNHGLVQAELLGPGPGFPEDDLLDLPGLDQGGQGQAGVELSLIHHEKGDASQDAVRIGDGIEKTRGSGIFRKNPEITDRIAGLEKRMPFGL